MGNIVWLASYPKSGNTWLRAFLANLIANRRDPVPLDELHKYCDDDALPEHFTELAGKSSTLLDLTEMSILRPQVHALIAAKSIGTRFVKTHNMAGSFAHQPLQNWDVTAGMIHIVRNPLDVVVSMTHHFGLSADEAVERLGNENVATENSGMFASQILSSWSNHAKSWADLPATTGITLRYEDLAEKPEKFFLKIARYIGHGADRERINLAVRHSTFKTLSALERAHGFKEASHKSRAFFRKGQTNEWRQALTREQIRTVIEQHGEQMRRFRYLPQGY